MPTAMSGIGAWDGALSTSLSGAYGPAGLATAAGGGSTAAGAAGAAGASSLLGPAATLLGAAAGAQGQQNEQNTTKDIPEWLKPYVQKQLGYASGLLDTQMAPGYMQGYDQMRTRGQGLLSQPIAGNGFAQFQAMPRFGGQ